MKIKEIIKYDKLNLTILDSVYPPQEDSFMLANHSKRYKGKVLDVGCGCGIQSLINAKYNPNNIIIGVDLNENAIENSIYNLYKNGKSIRNKNMTYLKSDLFSVFSNTPQKIDHNGNEKNYKNEDGENDCDSDNGDNNKKIKNMESENYIYSTENKRHTKNAENMENKKFDLIIFNPPYLPTTQKERLPKPENFAYDGGLDGRKIIDNFLDEFEKYLSKKGVVLLLQSSLNNLEKTKYKLHKNNFLVEVVNEKNFFFETLYVLKITKKYK